MYGGIFLLSLRCCVCAVVFVLLCLCCCVYVVVLVLLCLCCCVYSVVFTLLCPEFCPPTTHAVVFSIVAFLFMLVSMLWSDFGYIHFLKLHYVQYLPYTLSLVSWFPLILDIFPVFYFFMSIFLIIASWISSAVACFWIFSLLEAPLCPISPIHSTACFLIFLDFGYISCFLLLYVQLLGLIWKWYGKMKWNPSAITPFIIILQTLCNNPFIAYSTKYSVTTLS